LDKSIKSEKNDIKEGMCGDINIFLKQEEGLCEIDVMIAEESSRGIPSITKKERG
jgi:hypothetical protein